MRASAFQNSQNRDRLFGQQYINFGHQHRSPKSTNCDRCFAKQQVIYERRRFSRDPPTSKVYEKRRALHITTTYHFLLDYFDSDSGSGLGYQEPCNIRKTPPSVPRAPPIPGLYRTFDLPQTSSATPGFSTPPCPNHPRHGPPLPTEYDTASSVRTVRGFTFRYSTTSRRSVSACRDSVTNSRSVLTVVPKALRGVHLYSP